MWQHSESLVSLLPRPAPVRTPWLKPNQKAALEPMLLSSHVSLPRKQRKAKAEVAWSSRQTLRLRKDLRKCGTGASLSPPMLQTAEAVWMGVMNRLEAVGSPEHQRVMTGLPVALGLESQTCNSRLLKAGTDTYSSNVSKSEACGSGLSRPETHGRRCSSQRAFTLDFECHQPCTQQLILQLQASGAGALSLDTSDSLEPFWFCSLVLPRGFC